MHPKLEANAKGAFENHDILMRYGKWYLQCYTKNREIYNPAYVQNKVCPDCGPLRPLANPQELPFNGELPFTPTNIDHIEVTNQANGIDQVKAIPNITQLQTQVICDKCNDPMELVAENIWYCRNGHRKALVDLIESEAAKEKAEKLKKETLSKCPFCKKQVRIETETELLGKRKIRYSCGHTEFIKLVELAAQNDERDGNWSRLYPFQQEGVKFIEQAGGSGLIGDEMGLGKTVQALSFLRYNYEEASPCLMVCEASKVYDWRAEFHVWVGDKFSEIQDEPIIHDRGQLPICPGFKNYIISMSLLSKPKVLQSILAYGFKTVIIDESHSFKSTQTSRTGALQAIAAKIPNRIFLSGTPVMNKVMEYFVPLNILNPAAFPDEEHLRDRCTRSASGKILGLKEYYRPRFFHQISQNVIRRTKKDAGIKLPNIRFNKKYVNINFDKEFVKKYNAVAEELELLLETKRSSRDNASTILGLLTHARHVIGIAKVAPVVQMVEEFLESMDGDEKIAIGVHHKLVMDNLAKALAEHNPICISDEDGLVKMRKIEQFKEPGRRVAILSILGAGQGLNIQFCKNAIIAEREWNPAKEDQFCGRFHRINKNEDGTLKVEFDDAIDSVNIDILNVAETIDQFFDELVTMKGKIVDSTMSEDEFVDEDTMMDLARKVAATRLFWSQG